jgi:hypothetical protein
MRTSSARGVTTKPGGDDGWRRRWTAPGAGGSCCRTGRRGIRHLVAAVGYGEPVAEHTFRSENRHVHLFVVKGERVFVDVLR